MKKFVEIINNDDSLKSMIPLNIFLGDVSKRELSYESENITYIYSSRYQTNMLFVQSYFKHISRLMPKTFNNDENGSGD
jgi:hypothetical protein